VAKIDPIAKHPLDGLPYDRLEFVKMGPDRTPYYRVVGSNRDPSGALKALGHAFEKYGGACFYCRKKFPPQRLSEKRAHRDHVIPESIGGSNRLHNLVIACAGCGTAKANKPLRQFRPKLADSYLEALERHIARALGSRRT
jgi:5-methylcytosine-specific restriction endonuclease McrA